MSIGWFAVGVVTGVAGTIMVSDQVQRNLSGAYAMSNAILKNQESMSECTQYVLEELRVKGKLEEYLLSGYNSPELQTIVSEAIQNFTSQKLRKCK